MLCIGILSVHNRWCTATLVNYILVAIFLWCNVSSVRYIFGVMHFWYAMHRHLWCLFDAITIVQCIFGTLFLGLGPCNIFLVLRFWCYALSAISLRLATAVAHLLNMLAIGLLKDSRGFDSSVVPNPWPAISLA